MTHCKLPTKGGNFKNYVLELDGNNLVLSRPQSSQMPVIVYALDSFKCKTTIIRVDKAPQSEPKIMNRKALVLGIGGGAGHRKIFFGSEEALFECLDKVRE